MRRSSAERALCLRRTEGQQPHGTGRGVAGSSPAVAPHHAVKLSGKSALFCDMPKASNQRCGQGGCGFESRHRFQLSADDAGNPSGPPASPQYDYQVPPSNKSLHLANGISTIPSHVRPQDSHGSSRVGSSHGLCEMSQAFGP